MLFALKNSLSMKYCIKTEFPSVEKSEDGSPQLFIFSTEMKGNAQDDEVSPRGPPWTSIHAQYITIANTSAVEGMRYCIFILAICFLHLELSGNIYTLRTK